MADDYLDQVAGNARAELRERLEARPPDVGPLVHRAQARRRRVAGMAAAFIILAVAVPFALRNDGDAVQTTAGPAQDGPNADLLGPGEFRPMAGSPLAGRSNMAAVWTGRLMLLWGGDGPDGPLADGATYDPRADAWATLPASPLSARNAPASVWTGDEVVLWGGSSNPGNYRDGAAYNPATLQWRSIAEAPMSSAGRPVGLWTGSEMIVLAGFNSREAAAYNPTTDTWRPLPDLPGQLQAPNPVLAWANDRVFVVIEPDGPSLSGPKRLVSLQPAGDAWSNEGDLPSGQAVLASTGHALLVAAGSESFAVADGERREIAVAPDGVMVGDTPSVWTGTELILWEGDTASGIDPTARTWRAIPTGDTSRRTQPAVIWADGVLLSWGGVPDHAGGVMLNPQMSLSQSEQSSATPPSQETVVDEDIKMATVVVESLEPISPLAEGRTVTAEMPGGMTVSVDSRRDGDCVSQQFPEGYGRESCGEGYVPQFLSGGVFSVPVGELAVSQDLVGFVRGEFSDAEMIKSDGSATGQVFSRYIKELDATVFYGTTDVPDEGFDVELQAAEPSGERVRFDQRLKFSPPQQADDGVGN